MRVRCLRNLAFIAFLLALFFGQAYAEQPQKNVGLMGETTLRGRIIEINEEYRFVVINLGSVDGIKKNMVLSIFQRNEEAAKIKVTKVRKRISACEIQLVYIKRGIGIGDSVIYKKGLPFGDIFRPLKFTKVIEVDPIIVDIDAPKRTILIKTLTVFKEFGAVVRESGLKNYTLKAHKNLELPLGVSLITEWGPTVRNKIYYDAEVITTPRYNRLVIRLRGVYDREGKVYNREIKKSSAIYKEVQEMGFRIKDLAEEM